MSKKIVESEVAFEWFDRKISKLIDKKDLGGYDALTEDEKMIYLIFSYDANVRNGGIQSFLDGQNGVRYAELISYFRSILAGAVANDLGEVVDVLKSANEREPLKLRENLDEFAKLPIYEKFAAVHGENSRRYHEYDPNPLQLLYSLLKK